MPNDQKDAGLSADLRPIPSQAEGDLETIEEDLANRERDEKKKEPEQKTQTAKR